MTIYKTVIVEDEGPARRRLENMVSNHPALQLAASLTCGQDAIDIIPQHQPDLLLMDIQLKDKTAFEVLDQIHLLINSRVIFITAYNNYAIKAFEVEALDYLLKPYDEKRFQQAIARIIKRESNMIDSALAKKLFNTLQRTDEKIYIPEGKINHLFDKNDIVYIEADRYYVHVHTTCSSQMIRITMKKLSSLLPSQYIRINKSIIINKECIGQMVHLKSGGKVVLKNGKSFQVSPNYLNTFDEIVG